MINHVVYGGNLTRDPELKHTNSGKTVVSVNVANNKKWTDDQGQVHESVVYAQIEIWGPSGETFAKWHKKGQACLVEGELSQDRYEVDGKTREKTKIKVTRWHFLLAQTSLHCRR